MTADVFRTEGVWKIRPNGLVSVWADLPTFHPTETNVAFDFGPHFNYGLTPDQRDDFVRKNKIRRFIEIVEVYREPINDVDPSFRGRAFLVADFDDMKAAIMFKLLMPTPNGGVRHGWW